MGDIPVYTASTTREDFIKAMQEFSDSGAGGLKANFDRHFLSRAGEIYDWGEKYGINPELIVSFAWSEQGFRDPVGDESNFWGLETPNGASSPSYGSFENGMKAMAEKLQLYNAGSGDWREQEIRDRATQRQGYDSDGYGEPGTLRGVLSLYTDLLPDDRPHIEGDTGGLGGRAYLREIYGSEYDAKCGNVHSLGDAWTIEEEADASAHVYRDRKKNWETIFGKYATIGGGDILDVAFQCMQWLDEHNCTYLLGGGHVPMTDADTTIDCTRYTSWVLYLAGYLPEPVIYTSYDLERNPMNWPKITNKSELQPGDILVYDGHGDIYVGPGSDGSNENTIVKYNAGWETWKQYSPTYKYESAWREGYLFALRPTK